MFRPWIPLLLTLVACERAPQPSGAVAPPAQQASGKPAPAPALPLIHNRGSLGRLLGAEEVVAVGTLQQRVTSAWGGKVFTLELGEFVLPIATLAAQRKALEGRVGERIAVRGTLDVARAVHTMLSVKTVAQGGTIQQPSFTPPLQLNFKAVASEDAPATTRIDSRGALSPWLAQRKGRFIGTLLTLKTKGGAPRFGLKTSEGDTLLVRVVVEAMEAAEAAVGQRVVLEGRVGLPGDEEIRLVDPGAKLGEVWVQTAVEVKRLTPTTAARPAP